MQSKKIRVCAKLATGEYIMEEFGQFQIVTALECMAQIEADNAGNIVTGFVGYNGKKYYQTPMELCVDALR